MCADLVPLPPVVRVLLVEDTAEYRRLLQAMLTRRGDDRYAVETVGTVDEAVQLTLTGRYDVVVADYVLPDGTALDVLDRVRAAGAHTPIIVITAVVGHAEGMKSAESGASDFLFKDRLDAEQLERSIRYALAREQALAQYRLLGAATDQSQDALLVAFRDGDALRTVFVNQAYTAMLGYGEAEQLGRPPAFLESVRLDPTVAPRLRSLFDHGDRCRVTGIVYHRDGREVDVEWSAAPVADRRGEVTHYAFTLRDVTAQKSVELRLQQSTKMEAVGRLAGGVAHDFNNLLTAIIGYADLLLRGLPAGGPLHADALEIRQAADRAAQLTRQLLAFSRMQLLAPQVLDLGEVIRDIGRLLRSIIGEDVELVLAPATGPCWVRADKSQLEQVIVNLAVNARDAMPDGGRLTIEAGAVELSASYAREHTSVTPGSYVMLAVTDTGSGMSAATMARVFEPFFTTKEVGKGTGLGLATVYGIVKQSGGNIWVYSELGHGTTFKIYLPRISGAAAPHPREAAAPVARGRETLLLVEDEPSVRRLARQVLEAEGYRVVAAADGDEALRAAEAVDGPIDLLVTDVVMPGTSGPVLAGRLAAQRAGLRVLYMSGYTEQGITGRGGPAGPFLQKPFLPETLARAVRQTLDQPEPAPAP